MQVYIGYERLSLFYYLYLYNEDLLEGGGGGGEFEKVSSCYRKGERTLFFKASAIRISSIVKSYLEHAE
jgi:hypothetical protein